MEYNITDIDYEEGDAFLLVDYEKYYFQFTYEPTLEEALVYLFNEGKLKLCSQFYL